MHPIRALTVLPAIRQDISLHTSDGLELVGELALPAKNKPVATLVTLHPLPTAGGFMDSHILRKASYRLPAMADIAVLRFNLRGVSSPRGTSQGNFGEGLSEKLDVQAAMDFVAEKELPNPWLLGWSFGTELTLKYGLNQPISGAILLSPPLHRTTAAELEAWGQRPEIPLVILVPEFDDYLTPEPARAAFAKIPHAQIIAVAGAKHLWVGHTQTSRVLNEIVSVLNPAKYPLATEWPEIA